MPRSRPFSTLATMRGAPRVIGGILIALAVIAAGAAIAILEWPSIILGAGIVIATPLLAWKISDWI